MSSVQYIILDDGLPQEIYCTSLNDARLAIMELRRQDAVTVLAIDLGEGTSRVVNDEVATHWHDNHIDWSEISEPSSLPLFLQLEYSPAEVLDTIDDYQMGSRAYA